MTHNAESDAVWWEAPEVADAIRQARAEAWDEGYAASSALNPYRRTWRESA